MWVKELNKISPAQRFCTWGRKRVKQQKNRHSHLQEEVSCVTSHGGRGVERKPRGGQPSLVRQKTVHTWYYCLRISEIKRILTPTRSHRDSISMKNTNHTRRTKQDRQKENAYAFYGGRWNGFSFYNDAAELSRKADFSCERTAVAPCQSCCLSLIGIHSTFVTFISRRTFKKSRKTLSVRHTHFCGDPEHWAPVELRATEGFLHCLSPPAAPAAEAAARRGEEKRAKTG